jgi:hypothetical protein
MKKEALFGVGDLVLYNESGKFGNDQDCLFHVHTLRYGTCNGVIEKQYWYAGYLLKMGEHKSKGVPQVPVFRTTITNASEHRMKPLKNLQIAFKPY